MTTRAAYPSPGYSKPSAISPSGLSVTIYGESGECFGVFDFQGAEAPAKLTRDLVQALAIATGSDGRWRSKATVQTAASLARSFLIDIARDNPQLTAMSEFSAEMWWHWRTKVAERVRWPGQINLMRCLLYEVESLPAMTRRALAARARKPTKRQYTAYSEAEYRRIYAAAWRIARRAKFRISRNLEILYQYRSNREPHDALALRLNKESWTRGRLLDHMSRTGRFPGKQVPRTNSDAFRQLLDVTESGAITQAIFATTTEVLSAIVLLVCERGFNLSVLNGLKAAPMRADALESRRIVTIHPLDKPRRGPDARFFSVSLTGKAARIWSISQEITQPARDHLAGLGRPSDALLLGLPLGSVSVDGKFKSNWLNYKSTARTWQARVSLFADSGVPLVLDLRRLRLTEQVINQRPSQNSERISETVYRRPDPQTQVRARETILQGQLDAVADAEAVVSIRSLTVAEVERARHEPAVLSQRLGISVARAKQLLQGRCDTATLACLDMFSGPFAEKGSPCVASFLRCFSCPNAIVTPDHLPRLVILLDTLNEISAAVSEHVWRSDYLTVYAQLSALLGDFATEPELKEARSRVKPDEMEAIRALLDRKLDA